MMPSLSTGILLLSVLLLLLLRNAHCLSEGERCNRFASNECEQGLACVAVGTDSSVAHCARTTNQTCDLAACPSVWCNSNLQYTLEGECCPKCPPPPLALHIPASTSTPSGCTDDKGVHHIEGDMWQPDETNPCQRGYCKEGEILYISRQCADPGCDNPVYSADSCCPRCPDNEGQTTGTPTPTTEAPPPQVCVWNDVELREGESHCPAPNVTAVCHAGEWVYTHHCAPVDCPNPVEGREACDCPFCPENVQHFQVTAVLDMPVYQFARQAQHIDNMCDALAEDAGLLPKYNEFSRCNSNQICVVMNVMTSNMSTTEDDVVEAIKNEAESGNYDELAIKHVGHITTEKRRSVRSADSVILASTSSDSPSSTNRHSSTTTTIIAVTAAVCGTVASVVGVALLASYVRRKQTLHKTITV